jgi:FAD/FMN-containing dehydrogenase
MQRIQGKLPLSAAEFFCERALDAVLACHQLDKPLQNHHAFYLLLEFDKNESHFAYVAEVLQSLEVVVASHAQQAKQLWCYRELISSTLNPGKPYKNDIACRLQKLPAWLADLQHQIQKVDGRLQVLWFGHLGDGNVHINIVKPGTMLDAEFECLHEKFDVLISQVTIDYSATASAEHGIGVLKKGLLQACRSEAEIRLYRDIKKVFDPNAILNTGKILD